MTSALSGIRVLDFSSGMAGPLATMILADYGAEVIRVEPDGGDHNWTQPAYLLWNRGKKSIYVDLHTDAGQEAMKTLIAGADVLIETMRPGEADALGIGYDAVAAINPSLVYCSISAFGQTGPYRNLKAYDGIVNAKAGRMHDQVGHYKMRPIYRAVNDTSFHTSMFAVQSILAALRVAWITGQGQRVDTSLLRGVTAPNNPWRKLEGQDLPADRWPGTTFDRAHLTGDLVPERHETDPVAASPGGLCVECKDGRWIMHSHAQPELFKAWIKAIGLEWIWDDERFKGAPRQLTDDDRVALNYIILDRMKEKTSEEWIDIYIANPDCAGEVMHTTQEALSHPQFVHNGLVVVDHPAVGKIKQIGPIAAMSETPPIIRRAAPVPGQHTTEILSEGPRHREPIEPSGTLPAHPLEGVVVLELATWLAAPFAGALLAELGARVIKIEPPKGDPYRALAGNDNMIRATQGKESLTINLKSEEGQEVLHQLVAKADILIHNFRPGVPDRIGLSYDQLKPIKPDLVYVYAASYGSTGPHSQRVAFNPTIGALSGNSVFQSGEGNLPIGDQSPDPLSGSGVATGAMLGLAARLRTGKGQYVETRMMSTVVYCNSDDALSYEGKPPRRVPDKLQLGLEATYRLYETKDGWVFLAVPQNDEFVAFCAEIGRDDLPADGRFNTGATRYRNRVALSEILEPVFMEMTADEWEARLTAADLGCVRADGPGHRRFLYEDPHTQALNFMVPTQHRRYASEASPEGKYWRHGPVAEFSKTPNKVGQPFGDLGEHSRTILDQLGYTEDQISKMSEDGVAYIPAEPKESVEAPVAGG